MTYFTKVRRRATSRSWPRTDDGELSVSTEAFERTLSVNLMGVFFCFKYTALHMIKRGSGGRLIAAASIASKKGMRSHILKGVSDA